MPPEDSNTQPHSLLTAFVKAMWHQTDLSQSEYVEYIGLRLESFGTQTLSKFINGRYKDPPDGLVEALAQTHGIDRAQLEAWNSTRSATPLAPPSLAELGGITGGSRVGVRIIAGHTAWAASLIRVALRKSPPAAFAVGTFVIPSSATEISSDEIVWFGSAAGKDKPRGPISFPGPLSPHIGTNPAALSAWDVEAWLQEEGNQIRQGNEILLGGLPWDLVRSKPGFWRLATLVDSSTGCVAIVPAAGGATPPWDSSPQGVLDRLQSTEGPILILAEGGTVASERAGELKKQLQGRGVVADMKTRDLATISWKDLQQRYRGAHVALGAVIAWEPQASWLVMRSARENVVLDRLALDQPAGRPLTFDLVAHARPGAANADGFRRLRLGVARLLGEILPAIQREARAIREATEGRAGELRSLAEYFGLRDLSGVGRSDEEICAAFRGFRFRTYPDLNSMEDAGFPVDGIQGVKLER